MLEDARGVPDADHHSPLTHHAGPQAHSRERRCGRLVKTTHQGREQAAAQGRRRRLVLQGRRRAAAGRRGRLSARRRLRPHAARARPGAARGPRRACLGCGGQGSLHRRRSAQEGQGCCRWRIGRRRCGGAEGEEAQGLARDEERQEEEDGDGRGACWPGRARPHARRAPQLQGEHCRRAAMPNRPLTRSHSAWRLARACSAPS